MAFAQTPKSIVIGVDGLGYGSEGFDAANTPVMDSLINGTWRNEYRGAYSDNAFAGGVLGTLTQQPTVSGPGWSTILTGVWTDRHGVSDNGNTFVHGDFVNNPPYLGTVKSLLPTLVTASFVNWGPIDSIVVDAVDHDSDPNNDLDFRADYANDQAVANAVVAAVGPGGIDPDLVFIQFDEVDGAGHASGSSFAQYREQIETTDGYIGSVLSAIAARPDFENEYWQIIVTSDHGHRPNGGHGGQTSLERTIPFIVASRTLRPGDLPDGVSHADVVPTVLEHMQMPIPGYLWGSSRASGGKPVAVVVEEVDFEGLNLFPFTVSNAGDRTDWTATIGQGPTSWTIDNTQMDGNTTELAYFGWTAMDVDSWIQQQGSQVGRSSLATTPHNTLLVADPDAWDDFTTGAGPQGFNSFIQREFDLSNIDRSRLRLTFDYEFVTEDTQMGNVQLSFDQGANWQTLLEFDSTQFPNDTFLVGPGGFSAGTDFSADSNSMLIRFGCFAAENDWWFAVDNIRLSIPKEGWIAAQNWTLLKGLHTGGGLESILVSDNVDLALQRDPLSAIGEIAVELESISPHANPSCLEFQLESSAFFRSEVIQHIEFYDFDVGEFAVVDQRAASRLIDSTVNAVGNGDLSRFVQDVTGIVRARVRFKSAAGRQRFSLGIDRAVWKIE